MDYIRRPAPARSSQDCLQLDWAFGVHVDYRAAVHNLSCVSTAGSSRSGAPAEQRKLFYPLAHIGVLYDAVLNTQQHLLGHAYSIVASCCSHSRRFIVTVDEGDRRLWGRRGAGTGEQLLSQEQDFLATAAEQEQRMVRDPASAAVEAEDDGSLLIVWDVTNGLPVRTVRIGAYGGAVSCAISPDGLYVATLNRRSPQELMIWGWTAIADDSEAPLVPEYVRRIPAQDEQTCVRFSPDDPHLLCTNGLRRVLFWSWREGKLTYYSPPVIQSDWQVPIGNFTQSVFVPGTTLACSGTVDGDVVLWELQPRDRAVKEQDKTLRKMVRVHGGGGVACLTTHGGYIVTGGMDGQVKFLDAKLRLVAWFEDINGGPIISISFDAPQMTVEEAVADAPRRTQQHLSVDGVAAAEDFLALDFVVSTANAMIIDVPAKSFHTGDRDLLKGKLLVQGQDQAVQCVAAHPTLSRIAVGGHSGCLHLWDYQQRRVVLLSLFRDLKIQSLAFDPTARYLAVGFVSGTLKLLDAETLAERQTFRSKTPDSILRLVFSADGRMLASGTAGGRVGLYEFTTHRQDPSRPMLWTFIGHHKTHKAPISGLQFQRDTNGESVRLLSVGQDKRLIEYNLVESEEECGLLLRTAHKITQGALPTGFLWVKSPRLLDARSRVHDAFGSIPVAGVTDGADSGALAPPEDDDCLLIATNACKVGVYLSDWSRQCVKTVLAPTFGGSVTSLMLSSCAPEGCDDVSSGIRGPTECLVYATAEKVVGLIQLPLRGDPCASMGLLAHPGSITSSTLSHDGRYLFTAGGDDQSVFQWRIDGAHIMAAESFGAVDAPVPEEPAEHAAAAPAAVADDEEVPLAHLVAAVEGGADGELMREVVDYYYYAQIRAQGEETTAKRELLGAIRFSQLANLLRALGYYPTELEIGHLTFEVASMYGPRDKPLTEVDVDSVLLSFAQFMRLYVNYRPVYGVTRQAIEQAFRTMGGSADSGEISRDAFFQLLSTRGEPLHSAEIAAALTSLLGDGVRLDMLEERITAKAFAENLLGFEDYDGAVDDRGKGDGTSGAAGGSNGVVLDDGEADGALSDRRKVSE